MKTLIKLTLTLAVCAAAFTSSLFAQLAIPSDGSDGALVIASNTVIDIRLAVSGTWSNDNTANAGKGIYDPDKWAVVFKYSSVVISNGATLTFTNHPTHAPVVWLVSGDVTINGEISLDGQSSTTDPNIFLEPGPGGFRGGAAIAPSLGFGTGFGPGGYYNDYGSYSTDNSYGNPQIVPLIGGSGGSGWVGFSGGAGGGAILIAAAGTIACNGSCHANGGSSGYYQGSGGGIRLVADQINGSGTIQASSGANRYGRIRLEANTVSHSLSLNPFTVAAPATPLVIWPDTNGPTVKVVSVASLAAPADPKAIMSEGGADLAIATTNAVILLQTSNFPTNGTVNVYIKPRNAAQSILPASFLSGDTNLANWQLDTALPLGQFVIQTRAVSP